MIPDLFVVPEAQKGLISGVVIGIVTNNKDPDKMGRIKVKFPWLDDSEESAWARIASLSAGKEKGMAFFPEVDDEVLVAFEYGDINSPFIIGSLWNGVDTPPEINSDGENNIKMIKTRSGHTVKFDDTDGAEKIEIIDAKEKNKITIDTKENKITLESAADIEIKAPEGKITLDAKELELKAAKSALIKSEGTIDIKAPKDALSIDVNEAAIKTSDVFAVTSGGDANIEASGDANIKGKAINLN